jgi:hypothetical protein
MTRHDATRTLGEVVPFVRGEPRVPHADETRALALVLYATGGARSPAAVERLLPSYLEPMGLPVPTRQAIATWAREEDWNAQADDLWRARPRMGFEEMQRLTIGTALVLARRMHEMATGLDESPLEERILTTKQYEIGMRVLERIPALGQYAPPAPQLELDDVPRDVGEAKAKANMIQRGRTGS